MKKKDTVLVKRVFGNKVTHPNNIKKVENGSWTLLKLDIDLYLDILSYKEVEIPREVFKCMTGIIEILDKEE